MEYGRKFQYGMEDFWYGMEMEWKKIVSMEYGKIVFHSIPYHALLCDGVETASKFSNLGDRQNATGGCERAVAATTEI